MWVDIDDVNDNDDRTDITAKIYRTFDHWIRVERDTKTKTCDLLVCDLANTLISVGLVRPIPKEQQVTKLKDKCVVELVADDDRALVACLDRHDIGYELVMTDYANNNSPVIVKLAVSDYLKVTDELQLILKEQQVAEPCNSTPKNHQKKRDLDYSADEALLNYPAMFESCVAKMEADEQRTKHMRQVRDAERLNCLFDLREALIRTLKAYTPILPTPPSLAVELKKVDDEIRTLDRFYFTRLQLHGTPDGWTKEATQLFATYALYLEDELKKLKSGIEGSTT